MARAKKAVFAMMAAAQFIVWMAPPKVEAFNSAACHQVENGDCRSPRCIFNCLFGQEHDPCQENPDQCTDW
jgi:hypothetical protein